MSSLENSFIYFKAEDIYKSLIDAIYDFGKLAEEIETFNFSETLNKFSEGEEIGRNERKFLTIAKITAAITWFTHLIGFPPSTKLIADVIGESCITISKILDSNTLLMLNLVKYDGKQIALKNVKTDKGSILRWKLPGRPKRSLENRVGGPLKVYARVEVNPLTRIPMQPAEKKKLLEYVSESYFINLYKTSVLKWMGAILKIGLKQPQAMVSLFEKVYAPIGEKIVIVARNMNVEITKKQEEYLTFKGLSSTVMNQHVTSNEIESHIDSILKYMEQIPDDKWRALVTSPFLGEMKPGELIQKDNQVFLKCGLCNSTTPQGKAPSRLWCRVCTTEHRIEVKPICVGGDKIAIECVYCGKENIIAKPFPKKVACKKCRRIYSMT